MSTVIMSKVEYFLVHFQNAVTPLSNEQGDWLISVLESDVCDVVTDH